MKTKKIETIIKDQVGELTDFDVDTINKETLISDFGFVSLDFLSIQVALKRALGINVDLNQLTEANLTTFGELVEFLSKDK
ncbi:hypothetical protein DM558_04655 [Entomomonas moraniae]|uniref:Carrier domain-containing protein n=1 Tax=Entomomonas moraniae TaxID=2213226 RepID=A0A3S9XCS6_9GAMM|nr:acyl carrier protein [Entomomonas moraniae]AZS50108.1 hypothetical protein DM558_04655 [Entomomonas moraniae]